MEFKERILSVIDKYYEEIKDIRNYLYENPEVMGEEKK